MNRFYIISDGNLEVNYGRQKLSPSSFQPIIKLGVSCLLIKKNDINILIDTGPGLFNPDENKYQIEYPRHILTGLSMHNVKPSEINIVILTHFHFDHCGGCITADEEPTFTNAIHYMQSAEIKYSEKDVYLSQYLTRFRNILEKNNQLKSVDNNYTIENSIEMVGSPGHTAGFQYVKFNLNNQNYVFPGDIIPTLWHLNSNNIIDVDYDHEALNNSKNKIIEDCINDDAIMIFQHSLRPTMGKLVNRGARVGFQRIPV